MKLNQPYYIESRQGDCHIDLGGVWQFSYLDKKIENTEDVKWMHEGVLPNSVYHLLKDCGILPDPYLGMNSNKYHWVDEKVWYFKKEFLLDKNNYSGKVFLCFDGVSYYCRLWVNGNMLGDHEGLFGGPCVEISEYLNFSGKNDIVIEVIAANYGIKDSFDPLNKKGENSVIAPWNILRDTDTSTGEFIVMGIWNSVRLEFVNTYHISRPYLYTEKVVDNRAVLKLEVELTDSSIEELHKYYGYTGLYDAYTRAYDNGLSGNRKDDEVEIEVKISESDTDICVYSELESVSLIDYERSCILEGYCELQFYSKEIVIDNPKLWYPNGMGEAYLYNVEITMFRKGKECDKHIFKTGIKTFTSSRTKGDKYRHRWNKFLFNINGRDFFLKGMNWQPTDFLYKVDEEKYRWLLTLAKDCGIQLMRVWSGGGRPENDIFYNLCDELGIMVWQDAPLANMEDTHNFNQEILESQVAYNLYRIRNHPSLVIHCGGNEINPYSYGNAASMFVIDRIIRALDGNKIFHYTTADQGSAHIYRDMDPVWYSKIYGHIPFVGESGIHSFPTFKAFKKLISEKECNKVLPDLSSEEFQKNFPELINHFTEYRPDRIPRMTARCSQIDNMQGITLERLCEASQVQAYEFYLLMIQAMRNNYPYCGGIMPWVFNRAFATVGIQLVDGEGNPGYEYYAVKNAYRPVDIMLKVEWSLIAPCEKVPLNVKVFNQNGDDLSDAKIKLKIYTPKLDTEIEYIKPLETGISEYSFGEFIPDERYTDKCFLISVVLLRENSDIVRNTYFIKCTSKLASYELYRKYREAPANNLYFESGPFLRRDIENANKAELSVEILGINSIGIYPSYKLRISNISKVPAYPVIVDCDKYNCSVSDNFFLLDGGETKEVELKINKEMIEDLSITVMSWNSKKITLEIRK